jgi:DivIVA domain-containing protein
MAQSPEQLDPHALARVEFAVVRRGYSTEQVDAVIQQAAASLLAVQQRMAELAEEVEALRTAEPPKDVADLDDNELMLRLGEKTARVLEAARESAEEIEHRSQERAAATLKRAKDEALRVRNEGERVLRETRQRVAALEKETERKAKELRRVAETDAERLRGEAEEVVRTARAEALAAEQEAAARADAVNQEAAENAARARAKVEALITSTRTQVESARSSVEEEAERIRREAAHEAEERVTKAEEAAAAKRAEAESAYEERVNLGRERGRELVMEAEAKREEILRGLARTRHLAQLNLEQLRVGRERLMTAFEMARATIDQATSELDAALPEAKNLAERLVERVGDDQARTLDELEAEFDLDRLKDLRILGEDDPAARAVKAPTSDDDEADDEADEVIDLTDAEDAQSSRV